jgi:hypothetical protein
MTSTILDVLAAALITVGVGMVSLPAAFVTLGVLLLLASYRYTLKDEEDTG